MQLSDEINKKMLIGLFNIQLQNPLFFEVEIQFLKICSIDDAVAVHLNHNLVEFAYFRLKYEFCFSEMATGDPNYHQVATAPVPGAAQEAGAAGDGAPAPAPSVFETLKSVAVRAMIFYFIMNFFRKPQTQTGTTGPDGTATTSTGRAHATNLYSEGMGFDLYIYVSEQEDFNDFNVSLLTLKS